MREIEWSSYENRWKQPKPVELTQWLGKLDHWMIQTWKHASKLCNQITSNAHENWLVSLRKTTPSILHHNTIHTSTWNAHFALVCGWCSHITQHMLVSSKIQRNTFTDYSITCDEWRYQLASTSQPLFLITDENSNFTFDTKHTKLRKVN